MTLYSDTLTLQWHLTDRCRQGCLHCYREPRSDLDPQERMRILEQYEALLETQVTHGGRPMAGRLHLTGGEPFLAEGIWGLLEQVHHRRLPFGVMTTGLDLGDREVRHLRALEPLFVQVSLDGGPPTHDHLRGEGNHAQVLAAIQRLSKAGLWVSVSFTAMKSNAAEFPDVVEAARRYGARSVWSDRLVPCGQAAMLREEVMDPEDVRAYVRLIGDQRNRQARRFRPIRVQADRALQFQGSSSRPYRCKAGSGLITVLADGTLCPCRRMPIPVGKLPEDSLVDRYLNDPLLGALRAPDRIPEGCTRCAYASTCRGGLRCLAWALTGDPFRPDPGCGLVGSGV